MFRTIRRAQGTTFEAAIRARPYDNIRAPTRVARRPEAREEPHLRGETHLAYLVKKRACRRPTSSSVRDGRARIRERALLVSEKLAFEKRLRIAPQFA